MGRVLTNNTSFAYAIQDSFGTLGADPTWRTAEPNGNITFGASITTEPRAPISKNRQRRKGSIVDLDSEVSFETDLTMSALVDFAEGFCFAQAVNFDLVFEGANATATTDLFTVPSLTAAQAAKLQWVTAAEATLLWATGYANAGNNGQHVLTANPTATDTTLEVTGSTLVTETAPTNATLSVMGIRAGSADLDIAVSGTTGTLTSAANLDFTSLGLTAGQLVHVGGLAAANQFNTGSTAVYGFARITAVNASTLELDKIDSTLVTNDGIGDNVDLLFGRFVRNVTSDATDFIERYFQFEAGFPNLFVETDATEPDGFEYALDNLCNSLEFNFPLTSLAKMTPSFVGTDTEAPVDNGARKTNADTPVDPIYTTAFNTSADYARLRITDTDETGLTTDFRDWTLTLNNNASGEKVQNFLGSKFINTGNFEVDVSGTFIFTEPNVPARIRANTTVTMDVILENSDGGFAIDLPAMTLGDGARDYAINESVKVNLTGEAFQDPTLGTSIGISIFPATPTSTA